jgi:hypothetical protein
VCSSDLQSASSDQMFPLRTTADLSDSIDSAPEPLPVVIGEAWVDAVRLDGTRRRYLVADHVCASVVTVTIAGQSVQFRARTERDRTGRPITTIETTRPALPTDSVRALVRGTLRVDGTLADLPTDALDIVLAAGGIERPERTTRTIADRFREAEYRVGLVIQREESILSLALAIADDWGWTWSVDAGRVGASEYLELDAPRLLIRHAQGSIEAEPVTRIIAMTDSATVEVVDEIAVRRYGQRVQTWTPRTISSVDVLARAATARLAMLSRPEYVLTAEVGGGIAVGDIVECEVSTLPVSGVGVVVGMAYDPDSGGETATVSQRPVRPAAIREVYRSVRTEATGATAVSVDQSRAQQRVVVVDALGVPMAGAEVTVDGRGPLRADGAGAVQIPTAWLSPGSHTIVARGPDGRTATMVVSV